MARSTHPGDSSSTPTLHSCIKQTSVSWSTDGFTGLDDSDVVGIEIGASIESRLTSMGIAIKQFASIESAFLMLEKKRIAVVVTNTNNGLKYATDSITHITPAIEEKPYYLMVSFQFYSEHTALVERIWKLSGQMQEQVLPNITAKYKGLKAWPTGYTKRGPKPGTGAMGKSLQPIRN